MRVPAPNDNYGTVNKVFRADCVFETNSIQIAKKIVEEEGIKTKEDFGKFAEREDVTGCDWIKFLIDEGFIF
jgi:hypothetical protein